MKDNQDRPDERLPARRTYAPPPAAAADHADDYGDHGHHHAAPPRGFSFRVLGRALKRHWWWAVPLWVLGSVGLAALAYAKIKPTYDAISRVEIQNTNTEIYKSVVPVDMQLFVETQVQILGGPTVIRGALESDPSLAGLPMLRESSDPEVDIRKAVRVAPMPKTNLIQIELSSQAPGEAARIVNALVDYYVDLSGKNYGNSAKEQIDNLKDLRKQKKEEVDQKRLEVQTQRDRIVAVGVTQTKDQNAGIEKYRRLSETLTGVEIDVIKAKTELDQLRDERSPANRPRTEKQIEGDVIDQFYADPLVDSLRHSLDQAKEKLKKTERRVRNPSDPSVVQATEAVTGFQEKIDELWGKRHDRLREQLTASPVDNTGAQTIAKAELHLNALKEQETTLRNRLEQVRIESNKTESETVKLEFLARDLSRVENVLDNIDSTVNQLEFNAKSQNLRIKKSFIATSSTRPDSARRTQAMAAAPLGVGAFILTMLVLLELRGGRVGGPPTPRSWPRG